MNKQQFYTLGSALLASTALSTGAMAAAGTFTTNGATFSSTALKVANTAFSTTAGTADAISVGNTSPGAAGSFGLAFSNGVNIGSSGGTFAIQVTVGNATVVPGTVPTGGGSVVLLTRSGSASFTGTGGTVATVGVCT